MTLIEPDVVVPVGEIWRFTIPPGVVHDPGGSDTRREVILE